MTPQHLLVIPKRHALDYFHLYQPELNSINRLLESHRQRLLRSDSAITGFNIGMNCGSSAGQTIMHCHVHLIPRRVGDVPEPEGGVRHVIPGRGNYIIDQAWNV